MIKWAIRAGDGTIGAASFASAGEAFRARTHVDTDTVVQVDVPGAFETLAAQASDATLRALCLELAKRFPD